MGFNYWKELKSHLKFSLTKGENLPILNLPLNGTYSTGGLYSRDGTVAKAMTDVSS
jgi:hypothetical protein